VHYVLRVSGVNAAGEGAATASHASAPFGQRARAVEAVRAQLAQIEHAKMNGGDDGDAHVDADGSAGPGADDNARSVESGNSAAPACSERAAARRVVRFAEEVSLHFLPPTAVDEESQ
jgi:hypothetical protein